MSLIIALGAANLAAGPAFAGPPPAPVNACGALTAPGNYALTADLGPFGGNCLVVVAPNVTLDLAGHTVTGVKAPASYGILLLPSAHNAKVESTVAGAIVAAFHVGIQDDASGATITGPNLSVVGNAGAGVFLSKTKSTSVTKVVLDRNGYFGANVQLSQGAVLSDNVVDGNGTYGVWDQSSTGTRLVDNHVNGSGLAGVYLGCSDAANLQDVGCRPSDASVIENNALVNNGEFGIAISDVSLDNHIATNDAAGDKLKDLWDENFHCSGPAMPPNVWLQNVGTRNQAVSGSCIG